MPTTKVVRLEDLNIELEKNSKIILEDQKKAVVSGLLRSIPDLVQSSPVDTGRYASSWDFTQTEASVILGNFAPHAPIIELGARPFRPPLGPLLAWAKRVLKDSSQPPEYSDQVWALAVGVQKKIEKEGMKPKNVLRKAIPNIIQNVIQELNKLGR